MCISSSKKVYFIYLTLEAETSAAETSCHRVGGLGGPEVEAGLLLLPMVWTSAAAAGCSAVVGPGERELDGHEVAQAAVQG